MTAQKPRVYVMESQSFNLTPPLGLFLTEVRRWNTCTCFHKAHRTFGDASSGVVLIQKKGWRKRNKKKREKKKYTPRKREKKRTLQESRTHTRAHARTPRNPRAWAFKQKTLRCGTRGNENWGWCCLTRTTELVLQEEEGKKERQNSELDLIRQCGCVLLGLSLQHSVHRMHPPLAFDAVQIHPPLLRVMN